LFGLFIYGLLFLLDGEDLNDDMLIAEILWLIGETFILKFIEILTENFKETKSFIMIIY
jgi:hypothetical protein